MTLPGTLHRMVTGVPEKEIIKFTAGANHRADEVWERAAKVGGLLRELDVRAGDRVTIMVSNRFEFIEAMFGATVIGAVYVPLNTSLRGPILEHMLRDSEAAVIVVEQDFLAVITAALEKIGKTPQLLLVGGNDDGALDDFTARVDAASATVPASVSPYDNACILYTSGTTGPSKGVLHTQASIIEFGLKAQWLFEFTSDDVAHNCLPLFHSNAMCVTLLPALRAGATAVFGTRFSASGFWPEIRAYKATLTSILGAMVPILWGAEPSVQDDQNQVRAALVVPTPPQDYYHAFEKRFGLRIVSQFGMTDTSMVIGTPPEVVGRAGYAGVASPDFECIVADEHDSPLPDGEPGELIVRPLRPDIMMRGYWNNPDATLNAYRNLWFHTGDILVREPDGWYRFLDRKKDSMRRFGENISSWEVETVISMHPSVDEVAVYAVPSDLSEDEVMAAIVFKPGVEADFDSIGKHCDAALPYFASPRYLVALDALPKTENEKVRKDLLRTWGTTSTTVDRGPRGRKAASGT